MLRIIKDMPEYVFAVKATGKVTSEDLETVLLPGLEELGKKYGEIYYFLQLNTQDFTKGAWLQDMLAEIKHLSQWKKMAIVTDQKGIEKFTDMFSVIAPGMAKGFSKSELDIAKKWVSERQAEKEKNSAMNMSNSVKNLIAGFAGAVALNVLHGLLKSKKDTPRIDLVGKEAVTKATKALGINPPKGKKLYGITLAGDILSNALYYSMIGWSGGKNIWNKAAISGISAGVGAVKFPGKIGLHDKHVAKTKSKALLTTGYYLFGALVSAAVLKLLKR